MYIEKKLHTYDHLKSLELCKKIYSYTKRFNFVILDHYCMMLESTPFLLKESNLLSSFIIEIVVSKMLGMAGPIILSTLRKNLSVVSTIKSSIVVIITDSSIGELIPFSNTITTAEAIKSFSVAVMKNQKQ